MVKKLKNLLLWDNWRLLFSKPKLIFLFVLFDALFVTTIIGLGKLFATLIPQDPNLLMERFGAGIGAFVNLMFISIFYLFLILFAYSFFKYLILDVLQNYTQKTDFSFRYLLKFYLLNSIVVMTPILLFIIIAVPLRLSLKEQFTQTIIFILFIIFSILFYIFLNSTHSFFIKNKEIKKSLSFGLNFLFTEFKKYSSLLLFLFLAIIAYIIVYFTFLGISKATQNITAYYVLNNILMILTAIYIYLMVVFNRLNFYVMVNKENN